MLETFRKASQSWFIKILFGLLIISFIVFFGNSSELLRLSSTQPAIVVGHQNIGINEVVEDFHRNTERLQSMFHTRITSEQARQMGLLQQTVQQIVSRTLLTEAASDMGFTLDNGSLKRMIAETPAFQNQLKQFDKSIYEHTLYRAGLTEARFLQMTRQDAMRQEAARMVQGGVLIPSAEADPLFRYRYERRIAEVIAIPADKAPRPAVPDEATLKGYWQAHPQPFTAPEMRGFTAAVIKLADIAATVKPSEADITKAYQVRQDEFQTPEKRTVQQVVFDDEAKAQAFAATVKTAPNFAAAAKQAGKQIVDLGQVERKDLPFAELVDAVFSLAAPGVTAPVHSSLGWHVANVTAVAPAKVKPLAEVRDLVVQGLVKDEATNRLFALSTKLEDAIGSGAPVEEAAGDVQVKPLKVAAVDAQGKGLDGKPIADLPNSPAFREALFQTAKGETSEVKQIEGEQGYFVLRVDSVAAPTIKPFETVKDQVLAAWTQEERQKAAHRQAETLRDRLQKGEALAQVAKGFTLTTTTPFLRAPGQDGKGTLPALATEMFKLKPGEIAIVDVADGALCARLKSVEAADPKTDVDAYGTLRQQLSQSMAADLMQQYLAALQKDYGVAVHQAMIDKQFEGSR